MFQFCFVVIKLAKSLFLFCYFFVNWLVYISITFLFLFCLISGLWCSILWLRIVKGRLLILSSLHVKYLEKCQVFLEFCYLCFYCHHWTQKFSFSLWVEMVLMSTRIFCLQLIRLLWWLYISILALKEWECELMVLWACWILFCCSIGVC